MIVTVILIIIEIIFLVWVKIVRKNFQWFITSSDLKPNLSQDGLKKFFDHGYDNELGWVRKPNTFHNEIGRGGEVKWTTNEFGARTNPGFDLSPSSISCYGDSFTFCRQVNDDETWEHFLSKEINQNVINFGVGNYGLDQSVLRIKREYPLHNTKIIILGIVPDTISRIHSCWKHYYEYGNTFGFKPRFKISNNKLELVKNFLDKEEKFLKYNDFLKNIQDSDYFYREKFVKEIIKFPYSISILKNVKRNFGILFWVTTNELLKKFKKNSTYYDWKPMQIIMKINLKWRLKLFKDEMALKLFKEIVYMYLELGRQQNFIPILTLLPQKDDIIEIKKSGDYLKKITEEFKKLDGLLYFDVIEKFLEKENLNNLYSEDNDYGGHFSKEGNKEIAKIFKEYLEKAKLIN